MPYGEHRTKYMEGVAKLFKKIMEPARKHSESKLSIISYNMGTDIRDFARQCEYLKKPLKEEDSSQNIYIEAQKNTAKKLIEIAAEVYLLQEVQSEERILIDSLKGAGYAVFHILNNASLQTKMVVFDTAIALKLNMFENVENHSRNIKGYINAYDTAIVTAVFMQTKEKMMFVSAHVTGFDLEPSCLLVQNDSRDGDDYCQGVIDTVMSIGKEKESVVQIIGADMNANPEVFKKNTDKDRKWEHRFEKLMKNDFKLYRTKKATNVNPKSINYCERELDFIFQRTLTRTQENSKVKSLLSSSSNSNISVSTKILLKWDSSENASDHRPVLAKLSL